MKIGIDLGGSKIELIALDPEGGEHLRLRRPTPVGDYAATIALIAAMVQQAETELGGIASLGIGAPGAVSRLTGRMKNCNSNCLNGQTLQQDIEALLRRDVRLSNDANIVDPDVIVLGGGLSNIGLLYESVPEMWLGDVFSDDVHTKLLPPKHGDSSGVRGAAWLWGMG